MLSRRSFAKFCGLSAIPFFSGFQLQAGKKSQPNTKSVVFDSNLLMPDVASVFTKVDHLEFPMDFITGKRGDSVFFLPYMIQETIEYDSKYAGRTEVINRTCELLATRVKNHIEENMISLLFHAGSENNYIRSWKDSKYNPTIFLPPKRLIVSPEVLDSRLSRPNEELICSCLLGKGQPFQDHLINQYKLPTNSDICLDINYGKVNSIILSELSTLPAMMGFNTSFEFNDRTYKVTEVENREEGKELVSIAYFCAMGVLDHRDIQLVKIET